MNDEAVAGQAPGSVFRLIAALTRGTTNQKVDWQQLGQWSYRFDGGMGHVTLDTEADAEAPFLFRIFDGEDRLLESYEAPTRFSETRLDAALAALWRAIWQQERGRTVEPVIASLIEAAGGDAAASESSASSSKPDDAVEIDELPF